METGLPYLWVGRMLLTLLKAESSRLIVDTAARRSGRRGCSWQPSTDGVEVHIELEPHLPFQNPSQTLAFVTIHRPLYRCLQDGS